jgi:hypothetical protein
MRKLLFSLLLPFVLLLSQQGALVHELSHLRADGLGAARTDAGVETRANAVADPATPAQAKDTLCALCLAFSHLASPVASVLHALVLLDLRHTRLTQTALRQLAAAPPPARSRGPPTRL